MRNIVLHLMFDGARYHGFQRQKNGITIQSQLEDAVFSITGEHAAVLGCSRTDAGVHAENYVAMFDTTCRIPAPLFPKALNSALPDDIRVIHAWEAGEGFHPIFSAVEKTYVYTIVNKQYMDVFRRAYTWFYPRKLSVDKMREAASYLLGTHDFSAFMAAGGSAKTTIRDVRRLEIEDKDGVLRVVITANGFLYNMVRIIVGTLVCVGNGRFEPEDIPSIIESGDRRRAGMTAPPQGLRLSEIVYPHITIGSVSKEK